MTQRDKGVGKFAELSALFLTLNARNQERALIILRSLEFAQSVMCPLNEVGHSSKPHDVGRPA